MTIYIKSNCNSKHNGIFDILVKHVTNGSQRSLPSEGFIYNFHSVKRKTNIGRESIPKNIPIENKLKLFQLKALFFI